MTDPTKISEKHQQTVKGYCKSFFDKAADKHQEREKRKGEKRSECHMDITPAEATPVDDADVKMSDDEAEPASTSPMDEDSSTLKRKRDSDSDVGNGHHAENGDGNGDGDSSPSKRPKSTPPPVPPPPPGAPPEEMIESVSPPIPPTPPTKESFDDSPGFEGKGHDMDSEMEGMTQPSQIGIEGNV